VFTLGSEIARPSHVLGHELQVPADSIIYRRLSGGFGTPPSFWQLCDEQSPEQSPCIISATSRYFSSPQNKCKKGRVADFSRVQTPA
jgi:hypothetical protein